MEKEVRLYAEVRKRIGVVQVVILISKRNAGKIHTEVHPHAIDVRFLNQEDTYTFTLPPSFHLNPKLCQGLQWISGEGMHMRLQLSTEGGIQGDDGDTMESSVDVEMEAVRQSEGVMFSCSLCGGKLLPAASSFSRVLPLPSENWREMSGDWCCHGNDYTKSLSQSSLAPNKDDCFMSELYLSISPVIVDKSSVVVKEVEVEEGDKPKIVQKSPVLCQRCRHVLGEAVFKANKSDEDTWNRIESFHLYKHSIQVSSVQHLEDSSVDRHNIFRNYSLEVFLANHFVSLSKSQMTFKFIVESAVDNHAVLLVWLLSADTMQLTSETPKMACWEPFHCSDTNSRDESSHGVQCCRIAKILYQHRQDDNFESFQQQWNRDFGVETVRLPNHTCMELLLLLATSTENTPPSLRAMNGFKVGYLRMDGGSIQT